MTSRIERFEAELEQRKTSASRAALAPGPVPSPKGKKKAAGDEQKALVEEKEMEKKGGGGVGGAVKELFPFCKFFENAPAGDKLFGGENSAEDLEVARGCFRHISKVSAHPLVMNKQKKMKKNVAVSNVGVTNAGGGFLGSR